MNLQDVLTLAAAGYTRDEILAFETQPNQAPAPAQPAPAPAPAQPAQPQPAPAPAPVPANDQLQAFMRMMQQAEQPNVMQALRGMGQGVPQALAQYQQPAQPQPQQTQQIQQPAQAVQQAPAQPSNNARAEQILQSLGNLVQGVSLPNPELTIEDKLLNTLSAALGVKQGEKEK